MDIIVELSWSASQFTRLPSLGDLLPFLVLPSSVSPFPSGSMRLSDGEPAVRGGQVPDCGTDGSVRPLV